MRELRSAKPPIDPVEPLDVVVERERTPAGGEIDSVTIFLAGCECPFTCVFCDLWRHTLDESTPRGAIPGQIRTALAELDELGPDTSLKLYNASNFFEQRAVPAEDDAEILELCSDFSRTVVECHPRLIGERCLRFAESLEGQLEVAMGLETIHPDALPRLNKKMEVADFDRAAENLREHAVDVRAFVLIGAPFIDEAEQVEWTVRSVEHALEVGARVVSIIPMRGGKGEMERLAESGDFVPPTLDQLEEALDRTLPIAVAREAVVQVDTWDLSELQGCLRCTLRRHERLARISLSGEAEPRIGCPICAGVR